MYRLVRTAAARAPRAESTTGKALAPRHLMSINDVTATELSSLVRNAAASKMAAHRFGAVGGPLAGRTVAMLFSKLSTRTRVSTEAAVTLLGGHPMFLGKNDIQLGVRQRWPIGSLAGSNV